MAGLVLKLHPKERVLINGAVIENGDRRSKLSIVTPNANILRLRDAIHPEDAKTPVKRVCYIAQLVLSGDVENDTARTQLLRGIEQLNQVLLDTECQAALSLANDAVLSENYYAALKNLRKLLPREQKLLATGAH
ncbi:flagellar biosynthesis repressor FlbT [Thalassobium sp. R2A62]|uniref:flagellar biosynthesis repressor FlbT n=1 Tax=Thalassobium sp. R2A62 TaxID=633131 RepID=UPI0001B1D4D3|nr:flagellar biosynthesis repressor FlbT [Thalassobium sp. R2A62]EET49468.1 flagellar FlbT family protein [Thalassobium sp. R2A62]MDG2453367.1 flagellar biosynthesis repressor FlbT [Paracoccaceae bacterium]